jgi:hypothetical protein
VLSLRVSRDKRGYDYIYLLLETRRRGRVENRLLYCGRWPTPCRVGIKPFDEETRARLQEAHPDVPFDWPALLKTLNAALGVSRPPLSATPPPPSRGRRPGPGPGLGAPGPVPSGRPGSPYRQPIAGAPPVRRTPTHEPLPTEVVLVSAELEEQEVGFPEHEVEAEVEAGPAHEREPEFEPVSASDLPFTAAISLELMTDEIVHLRVPAPPDTGEPEPASDDPIPVGGHVFTEASGPATFDPPSTPGTPAGAVGAGATDEQAQRRRRRRRGGRGRGKPPDLRSGSEKTPSE